MKNTTKKEMIEMNNNIFMNEPIYYEFTDKDIIRDYQKYNDKKKVSLIWGIPVSQINKILSKKYSA